MQRNDSVNPAPFSVRTKVDHRGKEHQQIYVPSRRGHAWIEIYEWPDDPSVVADILDPTCDAEWKRLFLEDAYDTFRDRENERKRRTEAYGSEEDLWDPSERSRSARRNYLDALERDGSQYDPEAQFFAREEDRERQRVVAEILLPLTSQQQTYLTLSLARGMSYADIAREENPGASQEQVNKRADAIRKSVDRALDRIRKKHGNTRPDLTDGKGV